MKDPIFDTREDFDDASPFRALCLGAVSACRRWRAVLDHAAPDEGGDRSTEVPASMEHPGLYALLGLVAMSERLEAHIALAAPPCEDDARDAPPRMTSPLR